MLALLIFLASCAKNPVTGNQNFILLSEEQEEQLGQQSDQQIIASMGLYDDPELQRYLNELGQEMVKVAHRPNLGYEFKIVDSPVPNAFAVPGGYIYFTRGILSYFNNEAELAGVLGHEIGHISARHSAQQYSNNVLTQTGIQIGSVLSEDFRKYSQVAQLGTSLLFLKFGRDAERQSDELGVEYSTALGYDAREMGEFFQTLSRLSQGEEGSIPAFFSTHPDPGEREKKVAKLAERAMKRDQVYEINRDSYLERIDGMVYGENPRNGFTDLGHFYHPELAFEFPYPAGWVLQNSNSLVQINPEDQSALIHFMVSNEESFDAVEKNLVEQYELTITDVESLRINNLPSRELHFRIENDQQVIVGRINLIAYDQKTYIFLCISSEDDYPRYDGAFERTVMGFRELTEVDKLNIQPDHLRIRKVSSAGTLKDILEAWSVKASRHEDTAILNGMNLDDRVESGTLLKIIVPGGQSTM